MQTLEQIQHENQLAQDRAAAAGTPDSSTFDVKELKFDRDKAGMQWAMRVRSFPEIFRDFYDPTALAPSPPPPAHVQAALEDCLGDDVRAGRVKVAMHPFLRRWALWERVKDPQFGDENCWQCVSIFQEPAVAGELPEDLRETDGRFDHLRGSLGAFRVPNRQDFELVTKFDKRRWSAEDIVRHHAEETAKAKANEESQHEAYTHDMLGHSFNLARRMAVRDEGSGWNPISHPPKVYKADPDRYRREERNGFVIIHKRTAAEIAAEERAAEDQARAAALARAEAEEAAAEVGRRVTMHLAERVLAGESDAERAKRAERERASRVTKTM